MLSSAGGIGKPFKERDVRSLVAQLAVAEFARGLDAAAVVEDRPERSDLLAGEVDWQNLVGRIHRGEDSGMADLYEIFAQGIRFYLCRQLGPQELDDKIHDTFLIVVQAIRKGNLREPERLMGFVRTVVRRQIAAHIDKAVHSRRQDVDLDVGACLADVRHNPEQNAASQQELALMVSVLDCLSARDREILSRFYLDEQTHEEICEEMGLSENQFRLLKSRAKGRFGELGKRKLLQRDMGSISMRTSAGYTH